MNWAKKLLQPKDNESFAPPSYDCPLCGNRLRDDGDRLVCDQCYCPEPEDDEDDRIVCDVCGRIVDDDGGYPTCPVCGVALCGNKECANRHIAEHHPEWDDDDDDDDDDEDDEPTCDYCGRDIDPGETWTLETRDGTEHFCCAECRDERAAEIEAAPLCGFCHQKCTQGEVGEAADDSRVFCSTECLEQYRKAADHVCACCGKAIDGPSYVSPRYPKLKFCSRQCHDDYLSKHLNLYNS